MKQYTTKLQKNKHNLPLSPEVVAFQNSLPLHEGWGRQSPSRLLLEVGTPPPPVQPRDPAFPPEGQGPTVPPKAREDVGSKTPDHSIRVFVRRKGGSENLSPIIAQYYVWLGKGEKNNKTTVVWNTSKPRNAVGIFLVTIEV